MQMINDWFSEHKDAILVTDKINEPQKMAVAFNFKERLIMELFSWQTIDEAIKIGITPMASQDVLFVPDKKEVLNLLEKKNIKFACFSVRLIENNRNFIDELRQNNIKCYVFHVNYDDGIDENYVFNNYFTQIYGMYADNFVILQTKK